MGLFRCFGRRSRPATGLYQKRLQGRQIRVLEILPGGSTDAISCRMEVIELGNKPFEALSYVWGNPGHTVDIECNGHTMAITVNLADALRRTRLSDASRFIWADAICINQQDLVERSHQVQLMREIYSLALPVTVWLGHGKEGSPELVRLLLTKLDAYRTSLQESGFYNWPSIKPYPTLNSSDPEVFGEENMWRALAELFSAPWFSRIWCVQEVVLAQGASLLFGNIQIDWNEVACLAWELNRKDPDNDLEALDFVKEINYSKAYSMGTTEAGAQVLELTLHSFRNWQATDARDKVFGVLGLIERSQWETDIHIDYQKPVEIAYKEVAISSLRRNETLAILSFVDHGPEFDGTVQDTPSWVPRWDAKKDTTLISRNPLEPHWSACGRHTKPKERVVDCSCLVLDGAQVDVVVSTGAVMDAQTLIALHPSPDPHPILELWKKLLPTDIIPANMRPAVIKLCHTLALGLDIDMECDISDCDPEDLEEQERFSRDFIPYVKRLFELADENPPNLDALHDGIPGTWKNYSTLASQVTAGYRVFYTESGDYGIGPACVQQGDVVALLWGGSVPYIIRSSSRKHACDAHETDQVTTLNRYHFLGECYVDELMSGDFANREGIEGHEIVIV